MTDLLTRITELARTNAGTKALADLHPEVLDRTHIITVLNNDQPASGAYSYLNAVTDYECYVWVRKAVLTIANNIMALPLTIVRNNTVVETHDLLKLLADVNDTMSSADLWLQWTVDMLLGGEEAWELVKGARGGYKEIWPRQPHTLSVTPEQGGRRYFRVAEYRIDDGLGQPYKLPPDELVHFKFYNPRNPWRGIAPISAVRAGIAIDQYAQAWSRLFFRNSARPDYAIIAPAGLTTTERDDIEKKLEMKFGGAANAHKPIVLEQGVSDIKILSFQPKDMEWMEQRKMSREEVGAIFGVPDEIMGWGRDTYENFSTAERVLFTLTILPLTAHRDTQLTEYFRRVGVLRPDESVVTDVSGVSVLKEDKSALITQAGSLFDRGVPWRVINDMLGLGLPQFPGWEVGYLPFSVAPVGSDRPSTTPAKRYRRKAVIAGPEYESKEHRALMDVFDKGIRPHTRKLGGVVKGLLEKQRDEVIARLRNGKALAKDVSDVADDPFDRDEWDGQFSEESEPVIRDTVGDAGAAALIELGLELDFDLLDPAVVAFIQRRAQRFAEHVDETTWQRLKDSLGEGIDAGESITDLIARVESVMGDRIRSSGETIARTEVVGAYNGGKLESWKQSGVVESKTWLATLDDRVRDTHAEAHGQTVGIEDDFEVGGARGPMPGQMGAAEEDINCRCTAKANISDKAVAARFSGNGHKKPVRVMA